MINSIIFSKDRALQLRLLLESIEKNAKDIYNINIIYKSSNEEFEKGYEKLKKENIIKNINWVKENENFKEDVLNILNSNYQYSCFFTDDDIFFNTIKEEDIIKVFEDKDVFCFSPRLGENITYCYIMEGNNVLFGQEKDENIIKWDWQKHYLDFGYPISVDSHVFKTKDIYKLVKKVAFENPNTMEDNLQIFDTFPKYKMASYEHSVLVNTPMNLVQNVCESINSKKEEYSAKTLNQNYLDGKIIDYNSFDFSKIVGCHQELEFCYK